MAIKRRDSVTVVKNVDAAAADRLAQELADKPYGLTKPAPENDVVARTTISLPQSILVQLEDMALANKRGGRDLKNVSAIVRKAVEEYLSKQQ